MLKTLVGSVAFRRFAATLLAGYFRLVHRTCRRIVEPADFIDRLDGPRALIVTTWHGEHFMIPFVVPSPAWRPTAMISRSRDGDLNAMVAEKLGAATIRASGGRSGKEVARRGGVRGFVEALRVLAEGKALMITADVPKTAKVAGEGIVQLARRSGVPIVPVAAVTSRRKRLRSWDRAALNLPFGRFAIVFAEPIEVPADADAETIEAKRREVEETVNRITARAYEIAGGRDG
jgi:lysophospholipid acyltransferase (LPLAT)-like uncharacterized protein